MEETDKKLKDTLLSIVGLARPCLVHGFGKITTAAVLCESATAISPLLACAAIAARFSHGDFAVHFKLQSMFPGHGKAKLWRETGWEVVCADASPDMSKRAGMVNLVWIHEATTC